MSWEAATLATELAGLLWEMGKTVSGSAGVSFGGAPYKILTSLTTIEIFEEQGKPQWTEFVQDRIVEFRKEQSPPHFTYYTQGEAYIDELIVARKSESFDYQDSKKVYCRRRDIRFNKGDQVEMTLRAHSVDGFPGSDEWFELEVEERVEELRFVIIFPDNNPPRGEVVLHYRPPKARHDAWVIPKFEKYGTRYTTRNRRAFYWETRKPRVGSAYKIKWTWLKKLKN